MIKLENNYINVYILLYENNFRICMISHYDYLIVGAGLYGLTCARLLTNKGFSCLVIDKVGFIGGKCHTRKENGLDIHEYGIHVFHTDNEDVWKFVNTYSKFNQFELKVCSTNGKKLYPMPFNMFLFSQIEGKTSPEDVYEFISSGYTGEEKNIEERSISSVGRKVYKQVIKGYTEKQWGRSCKEMPAEIVKRIPVRYTYDNNYFDDRYQGLPENGYTEFAENILNGVNSEGKCMEGTIDFVLNVDFLDDKDGWMSKADKVIYCGSVDELLGYELGVLEWRSLDWVDTQYEYNGHNGQGCPLLNNSDVNTPYTRSIDHIHLNNRMSKTYRGTTTLTYEYPVDWEVGKERYYPNGSDDLYGRYVELLSERMPNVFLGGREGLYRYMDMDDTIECAMTFCDGIKKELKDFENYNEISDFCKLWVIGTNDYDININDNQLYYNEFVTNYSPNRQNINELNRFLCEYVAMWYVWKNRIYSDYVGFCHYRRMVYTEQLRLPEIKGKIQYFHRQEVKKETIDSHFPSDSEYSFFNRKSRVIFPKQIISDVKEYLDKQTFISKSALEEYMKPINEEPFYYYCKESFFCEWDTFCGLMQFIDGYVEFVKSKYNLVEREDWVKHISEKIISCHKGFGKDYVYSKSPHGHALLYQGRDDFLRIYDEDEGLNSYCNNWRIYAYVIEDLISIYIGTHNHIGN